MKITVDFEKLAAFAKTLNQPDLAKKFGVTQQTTSHRLKNIKNLRLRDFAILCEQLEKDPNYFYDISE